MPKVKFYDVEQNTDEWLDLRAGKITASGLSKVMANIGKAFGEPAKDYARQIAFERVFNKPAPSGFQNSHTQRGHEQEPRALMQYEEQYFASIDNGGFFDCGDHGCSPDGLIVGGGSIEIKSQIPHVHFKTVDSGSFPSAYKWQITSNCLDIGMPYIDCISYCDDVPDTRCLYVRRFYAEELKDNHSKIIERREEFIEKQVKPWVEIIGNSNYSVNTN